MADSERAMVITTGDYYLMRLARLRPLRLKKRHIVIGGVLLLILVLGTYTLWSKQVWGQYKPSYMQWHQTVQASVGDAVALPVTNAKEQDIVFAKFKDVMRQIDAKQSTICTINPLIHWQQQIINSLKDAEVVCRQKATTVVAFKSQLKKVIDYNDDDQNLAKILVAIPKADELANDTWAKQAEAWDGAVKATEKLAISDDFKATRQLAVKQMTAMKMAWQEVIAAHQAKDKQKYVTAQATLATAIDGLDEITVASEKATVALSNDLEKATNSAFTEGKF